MKNLEEEGLMYSTTDEYHFKSTANGWCLYYGVAKARLVPAVLTCHLWLKLGKIFVAIYDPFRTVLASTNLPANKKRYNENQSPHDHDSLKLL